MADHQQTTEAAPPWWQDHFRNLSKRAPKIELLYSDGMGGDLTTGFWEQLYQAFKQRMESENRG